MIFVSEITQLPMQKAKITPKKMNVKLPWIVFRWVMRSLAIPLNVKRAMDAPRRYIGKFNIQDRTTRIKKAKQRFAEILFFGVRDANTIVTAKTMSIICQIARNGSNKATQPNKMRNILCHCDNSR